MHRDAEIFVYKLMGHCHLEREVVEEVVVVQFCRSQGNGFIFLDLFILLGLALSVSLCFVLLLWR